MSLLRWNKYPTIISAQNTGLNPNGDTPYWTVVGGDGTGRGNMSAYTSNDLENWTEIDMPDSFRTARPVSLCVHYGKLFAVWLPRNINKNNFIIASTADGRTWSEARKLRFRARSLPPKMVSWRGRLWMASIGWGRTPWSNNHVYINSSEDGIDWPRGLKTDFKGFTVHIDVYRNRLHLIWVSRSNWHIYTASSFQNNGYSWERARKTRFRTLKELAVIRCSDSDKRSIVWSQKWTFIQPSKVKLYLATGEYHPSGLRFYSSSAGTTIKVHPDTVPIAFSGATDEETKYLWLGSDTYTSVDGENWSFQ